HFLAKSTHLTRRTPSPLRAKPAENELAFANNSLAQRTRSRLGHVVPIDLLNIAAAVTNEMMMAHTFEVEPARATLDSHFPHQTRLYQVSQIVISRRTGRARIQAIHSFEYFRRRWMSLVIR